MFLDCGVNLAKTMLDLVAWEPTLTVTTTTTGAMFVSSFYYTYLSNYIMSLFILKHVTGFVNNIIIN